MLALQKRYVEARMSRAKVLYERQIRIVDTHRLVYDLYGLTEEEVRVIERGGVGKFRKAMQKDIGIS